MCNNLVKHAVRNVKSTTMTTARNVQKHASNVQKRAEMLHNQNALHQTGVSSNHESPVFLYFFLLRRCLP